MATKPTPAAAAAEPASDKPTYTKAFFSNGKEGGVGKVDLFVNNKNPDFAPGQPAMFGTIEGKNVTVFVEPAGSSKDGKAYSSFLTIQEQGAKQEDGSYAKSTRLGTANMVSTAEGHARMAINIGERTESIWATPRKELSQEQLAAAGLDLEQQAQKRAKSASEASNDQPAASKRAARP